MFSSRVLDEEKKKAVPPGYSLPRVLKVASKTVTRMLRVVRLKTARKVRGKQRERSNVRWKFAN